MLREDGKVVRRHGDTAIAAMHLVAAASQDPGDMTVLSAGARVSAGGASGGSGWGGGAGNGADDYVFTPRGFGTVARRDEGL